VAAAIFASVEYRQDVAEGYYQAFLQRQPDRSGLAAFVEALVSGTRDEAVIADILGSDEFYSKM
jgi:hypothetical protein